jgi:NAD(P)-dependent dehydrogenase (short-subunit alcohol dehydrogenase family)
MDDLTGKVAVVTGSASGIGRALAVELAGQGCLPVMVDLDGEGLEQTQKLLTGSGRSAISYVVDVGDKGQMFSLAEKVARDQGGADLLINNAGISGMASFMDVPLGMIERMMQVNFWGVVYGCKAFLPQLLTKPEAHIVTLSAWPPHIWKNIRTSSRKWLRN